MVHGVYISEEVSGQAMTYVAWFFGMQLLGEMLRLERLQLMNELSRAPTDLHELWTAVKGYRVVGRYTFCGEWLRCCSGWQVAC